MAEKSGWEPYVRNQKKVQRRRIKKKWAVPATVKGEKPSIKPGSNRLPGDTTVPKRKKSFGQRLIEGGIVGVTLGEEQAAKGRKVLWGRENPTEAQLGLALATRRISGLVSQTGKAAGPVVGAAGKVTSNIGRALNGKKILKGTTGVKRARAARVAKLKRAKKPTAAQKVKIAAREVKYTATKPKAAAKHRYSKTQRQARRVGRVEKAAALGTTGAGAAAVAQGGLFAGETAKATVDDPGKMVNTTKRVAAAMPSAVVGIAADLGLAAKTGSTAPLKGQLEQQKNYWKALTDVTDPKVSDAEKKRILQEDLGFVPVITGALAGGAAIKPLRAARPKTPRAVKKSKKLQSKAKAETKTIRKIRHKQEKGPVADAELAQLRDAEARRQAVKKKIEKPTTRKVRKQQRTKATKDQAVVRDRAINVFAAETKHAKGENKLGKNFKDLNEKPLAPHTTVAESAQLVFDASIPLNNPARARQIARQMMNGMDKSAPNYRVYKAIADNPERLNDPQMHQLYNQLKRASESQTADRAVTHRDGTVVAETTQKYVTPARRQGVPMPEEAIPHALRGKTKVKPRKYQNAEKAIRKGEVQPLRKRVERLRAQAAILQAERPDRAKILRNRAKRYEAKAKELEAPINLKRQASALERQAAKTADPAKAKALRAKAKRVRKQSLDADNALAREFTETVQKNLREAGDPEPIFLRQVDATDEGALNVRNDWRGGRIPAKSKRRTGSLAEQGRQAFAPETVLDNLWKGRLGIEITRHVDDFVRDHRVVDGPVTGAKGRKMLEEGQIPQGSAFLPLQEVKRAFQRGAWDEAAGLLDDSVRAAQRNADLEPGKKYYVVQREAMEEFFAQMEPLGPTLRTAKAINASTSIALLGFNTGWLFFQHFASPMAMAIGRTNPKRWARVIRALPEYRKWSEKDRAYFKSEFGGTVGEVFDARSLNASLSPDTVHRSSRALRVAMSGGGAKFWEFMKKGGPLIAENRKFEAQIRLLTALYDTDKLINPTRVTKLGVSTARLTDTIRKHMDEMEGMTLTQAREHYAKHPKLMREIANGVDDSLGNWNAMTRKERLAASTTLVFYPFIRFSLRWALKTMPKNHPIKYAILLNLAQSNAMELEALLGSEPGFFNEWGQVVTHSGPDGEPEKGINLARAVPGGNAIIESVGGRQGITGLLRAAQPTANIGINALMQTDPMTGEKVNQFRKESEGGSGRTLDETFRFILGQLVGLPAPLRTVGEKIEGKERGVLSKAFREIEDRPEGATRYLIPEPLTDFETEKVSAALARLTNLYYGGTEAKTPDAAKQAIADWKLVKPHLSKPVADELSEKFGGKDGDKGIFLPALQYRSKKKVIKKKSSGGLIVLGGSSSGSSRSSSSGLKVLR